MEIPRDDVDQIVRQIFAGRHTIRRSNDLAALLAHALAGGEDQDIETLAVEVTPDGELGSIWHLITITRRRVIECNATTSNLGVMDDSAQATVRRRSDLRSAVIENVKIVDDFTEIETRATWVFEFEHGVPLRLTTHDLTSNSDRVEIEKAATTLLGDLDR